MSAERWIPIPRAGARNLPAVASVAAGPCRAAGRNARHAGQDLLQERRRFARRFAQAEYRRAAGLLQQAGGHQAHHHRNRRRPVGLLDGLAGQMFGLEVRVYMVKVSYQQKPYRRSMMQTWGAEVFASPSKMTQTGRDAAGQDPDNQGSLGWRFPKPSRRPLRGPTPTTRWARCSITSRCIRRSSARKRRSSSRRPATGRMSFSRPAAAVRRLPVAFPFVADNAAGGRNGRRPGWLPSSRPRARR
jgi:hypothetical protein